MGIILTSPLMIYLTSMHFNSNRCEARQANAVCKSSTNITFTNMIVYKLAKSQESFQCILIENHQMATLNLISGHMFLNQYKTKHSKNIHSFIHTYISYLNCAFVDSWLSFGDIFTRENTDEAYGQAYLHIMQKKYTYSQIKNEFPQSKNLFPCFFQT